jgi:Aminoglycoside adenylyltransferase, C-terminal domain/Nucleotidyltransferase domain
MIIPGNRQEKQTIADLPSPTAYAEINAVLQEFVNAIRAILRDQLVGLYLYGSLALGSFDPLTSDIDFIVLTQGEIPDDRFSALREMHARFDQNASTWSKKIEAAYVPLAALNSCPSTAAVYPQIEKGTALVRMPLEAGWAFQRTILREHGIAVAGPAPTSLVDPVEPVEMRQAAAAIIRAWQDQAEHDPSWIEWARITSSQAFLVLTLCRIRFSLETGAVTSKAAAARWVQKAHGRRWGRLIERALAGVQDENAGSDNDLDETLTFLNDSARLL